MEKNRIRPIRSGRSIRMTYQRQKEVLEIPNLIEVQKDSYDWFVTDGLREIFDDISAGTKQSTRSPSARNATPITPRP